MLHRLSPERRTEVEHAIQEADPLRHADRLRARAQSGKVLMLNAGSDEVIPRACTEKLAAALGIADRVRWLDGLGHYTAMAALAGMLRTTADFFAQDLPPGVKPPQPASRRRSPQRTVGQVAPAVRRSAGASPRRAAATSRTRSFGRGQDGRKIAGRLRMIRGPKPKFSIYCQLARPGRGVAGLRGLSVDDRRKRVVFKGRAAGVSPAGAGGVAATPIRWPTPSRSTC